VAAVTCLKQGVMFSSVLAMLQMKEYIRGRLEKAVHNYDKDSKSRSLMDFIQANVRLRHVICAYMSRCDVVMVRFNLSVVCVCVFLYATLVWSCDGIHVPFDPCL